MGIRMGMARDSAGAEWTADRYSKGKGMEPLRCFHCPVQVTHQSAHTRERDDKPVLVPAYFRLLPGGQHADGCKHAVAGELHIIASESRDIFESTRDGRYRLRLVMIRDSLAQSGKRSPEAGSKPGGHTSVTYERSRGKLPAYINSAKRVLKLRALCDNDDEIASHLELVFESNTIVPWSQFYFETERHLDAYRNAVHNTVEHPVALHGTVKSKRVVAGKNGPVNVVNLAKSRYVAAPDHSDMGVGVEVSIWCEHADWLADVNEDDDIIVLGMWKAKAGEPSNSRTPDKYRYKSFTTHKLAIRPVLAAQIARLPRRS